ncbi:DNA-binding protein REB1 [Rhodamnia argentea]|uniref:DNA-binding protein REB1 n=1 Tax=Rhodamnia argentea TaxID=178133 RepID=A0A8B8QCW8_9MYRT|nr:DNA-binding protein REB1 [Rhodamnia argentea]
MGRKKEKRGRIEENRFDVVMDVDHHEVDAGDRVENGVDKVNRDKKKSRTKGDVHGDGSEFVAENVKGSVGDDIERGGSEKKKKKRKREVGQDEKELEKAAKKGRRHSKGTESSGARSISKVPQIGEYEDGHMRHGDFKNMEERLQIQTKKENNKKHKEVKKMDDIDAAFSATKHLADDKSDAGVQEQNKSLGKNIKEMKDTDQVSIKKKKKKKGSRDTDPVGDNQKMKEASGSSDVVTVKKDIHGKERSKRKKQKRIEEQGYVASGNTDKKHMESELDAHFTNDTMGGEEKKPNKDKKRKKEKAAKDGIEAKDRKKKPKRVSFAENVEVFPPLDGPSEEDNSKDQNLVRGKKFSEEEDELVKQAVYKYIEAHDLGEDGLNMVLNCGRHREARKCWKEIGAYLPWRPKESVYHRAHLLFERGENHTWTPEECELVRKFHEQHGSDWRKLADALGRHRFHVKDTWRRIKFPYKKGPWSQDEYQSLFDLVNMDLRLKVTEERKSKHGMLLDNIAWGAISDSLGSRNHAVCCEKWYKQLTSSMVAEGCWADTDDYRLLSALVELDACSMEDVDWDKLIENKSGDLCRRRWNQMVKYIGNHWSKSFPEQVEILSERYCPDMLEPREIYANKPIVT